MIEHMLQWRLGQFQIDLISSVQPHNNRASLMTGQCYVEFQERLVSLEVRWNERQWCVRLPVRCVNTLLRRTPCLQYCGTTSGPSSHHEIYSNSLCFPLWQPSQMLHN
jgi:hypothetical protein